MLRRPCFIADAKRLVMPAFGAYTGGLNVLDTAFQPLFADAQYRVWVIGHEGIYPVGNAFTDHVNPMQHPCTLDAILGLLHCLLCL